MGGGRVREWVGKGLGNGGERVIGSGWGKGYRERKWVGKGLYGKGLGNGWTQ